MGGGRLRRLLRTSRPPAGIQRIWGGCTRERGGGGELPWLDAVAGSTAAAPGVVTPRMLGASAPTPARVSAAGLHKEGCEKIANKGALLGVPPSLGVEQGIWTIRAPGCTYPDGVWGLVPGDSRACLAVPAPAPQRRVSQVGEGMNHGVPARLTRGMTPQTSPRAIVRIHSALARREPFGVRLFTKATPSVLGGGGGSLSSPSLRV